MVNLVLIENFAQNGKREIKNRETLNGTNGQITTDFDSSGGFDRNYYNILMLCKKTRSSRLSL